MVGLVSPDPMIVNTATHSRRALHLRVLVATLWQLLQYGVVDLHSLSATLPDIDETTGAAATVAVETLLLGAHEGRLTYRTAQRDLLENEHPDAVARRLAEFTAGASDDGRILHSTSWRFAAGRIVLTYAALPDRQPATATILGPPAPLATGTDPLSPSPPTIAAADVVAHACRHLAFLRRTDPVVAAASRLHPQLWTVLDAYRPGVAGLL
jgi:hypothetical protein